MLVLTRYPEQKIRITVDDKTEILIDVVEIRGDKIRLGVTAPKNVVIDREEIARKIDRIGFDSRRTNGFKK